MCFLLNYRKLPWVVRNLDLHSSIARGPINETPVQDSGLYANAYIILCKLHDMFSVCNYIPLDISAFNSIYEHV